MNARWPALVILIGGCAAPPDAEGDVAPAPLGELSLDDALVRIEGSHRRGFGPGHLGYWGTAVGDLDGDGLADVVGTEFNVGVRAAMLRGHSGLVDLLDVPSNAMAVSVAIVDLIGTPTSELVVGLRAELYAETHIEGTYDAVRIVSVDRTGSEELATLTHHLSLGGAQDYTVGAAGDLDGDGHPELTVESNGVERTIWLLHRPADGDELNAAADVRLFPVEGENLDYTTSGDFDGDGLHELVVRTYTDAVEVTGVVLRPPARGDVVVERGTSTEITGFPGAFSSSGDLDGDGRDDLVAGGPSLRVFGGPLEGSLGPDDAVGTLTTSDGDALGGTVGTDLDGDGRDDLLVSVGDGSVAAAICYGPFEGSRALSDADARFIAEPAEDLAGSPVLGRGDMDGDGFGDLAIGARGFEDFLGAIYVVQGGER